MNRTARSFVALFALLALAGAQVFGLQKGFLCDCTGEVIETSAEYCHHSHGNHHTPCAEDHHEHDAPVPQNPEHQGGSHEHAPLKVQLTAASQGKDASASVAFTITLSALPVAELPDFLFFLIASPGDASVAQVHRAPPPDAGGNATAAVQVAECMVLLV
jgi:hypothetical protein